MSAKQTDDPSSPIDRLLQDTFRQFYKYISAAAGEQKAGEFARKSYQAIGSYFRNLSVIQLGEAGQLEISNKNLTDKEILAFSVWMQQFVKELKNFMIGLGKVDAVTITQELQGPLQDIGFYDFFEQAKELTY